jgi:hypothetical protein
MGVARGVAPFHHDSREQARNNGQDRKRKNECRPDVPSQNEHGRFIGNSTVELTQKRITASRPSVGSSPPRAGGPLALRPPADTSWTP